MSLLLILFTLSLLFSLSCGEFHLSNSQTLPATGENFEFEEVSILGSKRYNLAEVEITGYDTSSSSMILASERTYRKDPLDGFNRYTRGYNISDRHYWASVSYTAAPFFILATVWFIIFGLFLSLICLCHFCCLREPYGYSRIAYALSLIFLVLFTVAAMYKLKA